MNDFLRPRQVPTVYALGTVQTPTGAVTGVAMKMTAGLGLPSQVHLADGSYVVPDATGTIIVPSSAIAALQAAGFVLV